MLSLPLVLRVAKNQLNGDQPWLVLLDITLPDESHIRLVSNADDVVYGGHIYTAFAFQLGELKSPGDGRITGISVQVANPERSLQPYLEDYDGLVGCPVKLSVVHAGNLAADHSELELDYEIIAPKPRGDWIDFALGAVNPLRRRYPLYQSMPRACGWVFKGAECAYAGTATACGRTLDACRALGNSARFGGRPGMAGAPRFVTR